MRKLLEVHDTFFWNFRGPEIIRGWELLEVARYVQDWKYKTKFHALLSDYREPDFIVYFDRLETLVLDHNCINEKVVFPKIQSLTTLWLNFNLVGNLFPFIENLSNSFPKLHYLSMMGNPAAPSFINNGKFHDYLVYR